MALMQVKIDGSAIKIFMYYITYPIKKPILFITEKAKNRVNTKELTKSEKQIILNFYSKELNEFTLCGQPILIEKGTLNIIDKLYRRKILVKLSDFEEIMNYNGRGTCYYLNPKALKILNKKKNRNEILNIMK